MVCNKNILAKIVLGLVLSMLLSACDRSGPLCYYADDFGDIVSGRVSVPAAGGTWVDTGVDVLSGHPLQIRSSGSVNLCSAASVGSGPLFAKEHTYKSYLNCAAPAAPAGSTYTCGDQSPRLSEWQDISVNVVKGKQYKVTASGTFACASGCTPSFSNGNLLYLSVGVPSGGLNGQYSPGGDTRMYSNAVDGHKDPNFMEVTSSGITFVAQRTGPLYVRYRDNNWVFPGGYFGPSGWYPDNVGGYDVTVEEYGYTAAKTLLFNPDPTVNPWQNSSISLDSTQYVKYRISVSGAYSLWGDAATPSGPAAINDGVSCHNDKYLNQSTCWISEGRGLFTYIGDVSSIPAGANGPWFGDTQVGTGSDPQFFEAFQHTPSTSYNGTSGVGPIDITTNGDLNFRYRDQTAGAPDPSSYTSPWYSDNQGGYLVAVSLYKNCDGRNGNFMTYYIGGSSPPSVTDARTAGVVNLHASADNSPSGLYSDTVPADGRLWLQIFDQKSMDWDVDGNGDQVGDNDYTNNSGQYLVDVVTTRDLGGGISDIIDDIIAPVKLILLGEPTASPPVPGLVEKFFNGITRQGAYVDAIRAMIGLGVIIFAMFYMAGLANITQKELLVLMIKIGVVITLTDPDSWSIFYNYFFRIFVEGTDELIWIFTHHLKDAISATADPNTVALPGNYEGVNSNFAFLNQTLARFFTNTTNIKISSLVTTWPVGPIYAIIIYAGIIFFLFAVIKAIIVYMTAIMMVSLLLFLAPIFIPFMLFGKTKPLFNAWIDNLFSYLLQPVFLFTVIALFNVFIYSTFYNLLSFTVCWSCFFEIDLPISELMDAAVSWAGVGGIPNFDKFCLGNNYMPWGTDDGMNILVKLNATPVSFYTILIFMIFIHAMYKFGDWAVSVANNITAGNAGTSASGAVGSVLNNAMQFPVVATQIAATAVKDAMRAAELATSPLTWAISKAIPGASEARRKARRKFIQGLDKFEHGVGNMANKVADKFIDIAFDQNQYEGNQQRREEKDKEFDAELKEEDEKRGRLDGDIKDEKDPK